jgi:hypothetical protein
MLSDSFAELAEMTAVLERKGAAALQKRREQMVNKPLTLIEAARGERSSARLGAPHRGLGRADRVLDS